MTFPLLLSAHPEYLNVFAGAVVLVIQFSYNLWMKYTNRKKITLKDNFLQSLFDGLIVTTGYYVLDDIKSRVNINSEFNENTIKASFIIIIFIMFMLTKVLINP
jgi:hypothetical protein